MNHTTELSPLGVLDNQRYAGLAVDNAEKYRTAAPFPNIVLDNFLPGELAAALARSFPIPDLAWVNRDNNNNRRQFQQDETQLPALYRHMLRELNSRQFLLFIETLTGIGNLLPDPYLIGGGVHVSSTGDFLKIHADFNWHHKLQAHRRVNALLYLNQEWKEEWQGQLEFWNKDMTEAAVRISPTFNRLVVFNTDEDSNHGQPRPNQCPPGVYRKVLNLYFYTTARDQAEIVDPHFTLYKTEASPFAMQLGQQYRDSAQPEHQARMDTNG